MVQFRGVDEDAQRIRIDCESEANHDLSMVEQARLNNKEIAFSGNFLESEIE